MTQNPRLKAQGSGSVTALVLNYRSPLATVRCVQALLEQDHGSHTEILVIDNDSGGDSIGTLRARLRHPHVRIIEMPQNEGYARGNNRAVPHATGEFVLIINPDNELRPDALAKMKQHLIENPHVGIVAPRLVYPDGSVRDSARAFPAPLDVILKRTPLSRLFQARLAAYTGEHIRKDAPHAQETDWIVGACLLLRKDLLEELGGFDERFFLFFEDIDLCRRCWEKGKAVHYLASAEAADRKMRLSEGGVGSLLTSKVGRIHIGSAWKYFRKWGFMLKKATKKLH